MLGLEMRKKLGFQRKFMIEKERVRSKVTPRKVGVGLKWRWELNNKRLGWRWTW